jgi:hypothetical protein
MTVNRYSRNVSDAEYDKHARRASDQFGAEMRAII